MKFTLPYPPSVNTYWRHVVVGRRVATIKSREARLYGIEVAAKLRGMTPTTGPVRLDLVVYRPRRVGDLDNTLKGALDAMKGFAFEDDSQVVEVHARREDDKHNPRVEVEVRPLAPPEAPSDALPHTPNVES